MNGKKNYIIIATILTLVAAILGGAFAYYRWSTSDDEVTNIAAGVSNATVTFDGGSDINATLKPVSDKSKGIVKTISVKGDTEDLVFDMYLDIISLNDGLKDVSFRYALYSGSTLKSEGNFSTAYLTSNLENCDTNDTEHLVLLDDEEISLSTTTYTLYIWIDGTNYTNPSSMMNKSFSFKLHAEGIKAVLNSKATEYITNLYTNASKSTVTNNNITYNVASSVNLMNDRLGGTTANLDGGNIRYYGANPDNYLWLGETYTSDYTIRGTYYTYGEYDSVSECLEDNGYEENSDDALIYCSPDKTVTAGSKKLYRIIGVFNNKLKVIANNSIGRYSWDTSSSSVNSGYGINEWSQADLMKLLNPGYSTDSVNNSLYWNKGTGICYNSLDNETTSCSFTDNGISSSVQSLISEETWYLGGSNAFNVYSNQMYDYERSSSVVVPGTTCSGTYCNDNITRTTTWTGKVALAYPSDYMYAANFNDCNQILDGYSDDECSNNNWLLNNEDYWFLTPDSSNAFYVFYVDLDGYSESIEVASTLGVRPVFYLNSNVVISSGSGTEADPYVIG